VRAHRIVGVSVEDLHEELRLIELRERAEATALELGHQVAEWARADKRFAGLCVHVVPVCTASTTPRSHALQADFLPDGLLRSTAKASTGRRCSHPAHQRVGFLGELPLADHVPGYDSISFLHSHRPGKSHRGVSAARKPKKRLSHRVSGDLFWVPKGQGRWGKPIPPSLMEHRPRREPFGALVAGRALLDPRVSLDCRGTWIGAGGSRQVWGAEPVSLPHLRGAVQAPPPFRVSIAATGKSRWLTFRASHLSRGIRRRAEGRTPALLLVLGPDRTHSEVREGCTNARLGLPERPASPI
jgi:hypothetical protein